MSEARNIITLDFCITGIMQTENARPVVIGTKPLCDFALKTPDKGKAGHKTINRQLHQKTRKPCKRVDRLHPLYEIVHMNLSGVDEVRIEFHLCEVNTQNQNRWNQNQEEKYGENQQCLCVGLVNAHIFSPGKLRRPEISGPPNTGLRYKKHPDSARQAMIQQVPAA